MNGPGATASGKHGRPAVVTAYIGLGANLGDAALTICNAARDLDGIPDTRRLALSSLYRSAPLHADGPDYINAVASLETLLPAIELLGCLQDLEQRHGRSRPYHNAPRTLDLDIILYDSAMIDSPGLTVPHPRLAQRAFVLLPLAELSPGLVIPGAGPVQQLLAGVSHQSIERLPGHCRS